MNISNHLTPYSFKYTFLLNISEERHRIHLHRGRQDNYSAVDPNMVAVVDTQVAVVVDRGTVLEELDSQQDY
jgi:hypothetical protein